MKQFAEQCGRLIRFILDLFHETTSKLSCLWAALAFAKDCLMDCLGYASEAKQLCQETVDKGNTLMDTSNGIKGKLEGLGLDPSAITAIKELMQGDEVRSCIDLAQNMDDLVKACIEKVLQMINRVQEGFENLPDILKDGIGDTAEYGAEDDDPEPANVETDVNDLEACRGEIEGSNLMDAVDAGKRGFSGVSDKVDVSRGMLETSEGFADRCTETIDSFNGTWDLKVSGNKIKEMCRIVMLGTMMEQFANQIMNLVMAILGVLNAIMDKLTNLPVPDIGEIAGDVGDAIGDIAGNLKFW